MSTDDRIVYEILADGTCSYCGREANLIATPDGKLERADWCYLCDRENEESAFDGNDSTDILYYG